MTAITSPAALATLASLEELADAGLPAQAFIEEAATRIDRVIPTDGFFLAAADPETALCMGAGIVHGMPEEICQPTWEHEFLVPDYNKFADLALGERRVADLHEATGGRLERSARFREYFGVCGFGAELRAAFDFGGAVWGFAQFNRSAEHAMAFAAEERAWMERVSPIVGRGLRNALLHHPGVRGAARGPGIILLDASGEVVSVTPEAEAWLADVSTTLAPSGRDGLPIPIEAFAFAYAARAGEGAPARARLRTNSGVWLLMHASVLRDARGVAQQAAIVIEPAKASDVAPLIVEAYALTAREVEVARLISRGLKTSEIAGRLFLSPHTVRDHVKAVFEKVGVTSRGELVAKLFAEHYHDELDAAVAESSARVAASLEA
jgi:DNA-binding CsgD family transcriptional regulator